MICNNEQIVGNSNAQVAPGTTFSPWTEDFCVGGTPLANTYFVCNECRKCLSKLQNLPNSVLVISRDQPPPGLSAIWFQTNTVAVHGMCTLSDTVPVIDSTDGSTDALRSFSKTSVLFVSISFIILMVISLALFNAARKALMRIPTRCLKVGDAELDIDCAVCIDPYQIGDVVRTLPCRYVIAFSPSLLIFRSFFFPHPERESEEEAAANSVNPTNWRVNRSPPQGIIATFSHTLSPNYAHFRMFRCVERKLQVEGICILGRRRTLS
ncbi:unnamed protein product [Nippostrongylus brasiliensis]|uniref:Protein goliath (inferred by orthology to a D. melanogaster protein) n=1 Tax=Nippostrongylus brasiliensis TaxID=27835 RepID=A0A158QZH0_NIPBR|nr:unnamed protein product [Nippostrongylus brasiliensis]